MMQPNLNAPCVLMYGLDRLLLDTRAMVVETAGFRTCEASSSLELAERLKPACCRAMVLCHTLSAAEAGLASALAKDRIPGIKVIAMAEPRSPISASFFDEVLGSFVQPEQLLSVLKHAIQP